MKNEEKLYLAIGEIDDELIKEASAPYKARMPRLYKGLTIAASVTIVSAAVIAGAALIGGPALDKDGSASPPDSNNSGYHDKLEGVLTDKVGNIIEYVEVVDEYTVKLSLNIITASSELCDFTLIGRSTDESGEPIYGICSTVAPGDGYDVVLSPEITVNGEHADAMPTDIGVYEIIIDFSVISEHDLIWEDHFTVNGHEISIIK